MRIADDVETRREVDVSASKPVPVERDYPSFLSIMPSSNWI
jgi:hypothetical protein